MKRFGKTLILIVVVLLILQAFFIVYKTYYTVAKFEKAVEPFTAKASGVVQLCINTPPNLDTTDCSNNATEDVYYSCWVNATDPNYINYSFYSLFVYYEKMYNNSNYSFFNVSLNGSVSFTPTNDHVGNYTIVFRVDDGYGCSNSQVEEYFNLSVINVNDAPVLIQAIDNMNFNRAGDTLIFYLNNHFIDVEGDAITYSYTNLGTDFSITINPVTSLTTVTVLTCDSSRIIMFIATDIYNASGLSNPVRLRCVSPDPSQPSGGGSGSGGGGGASLLEECIPEYSCFDYHRCNISNVKPQRCVDKHGCQDDVFIEVPCVYRPELDCNESWNCSEWDPCLPNGTQTRKCTDINDCGTLELLPPLVQDCEYIGTCEDGIKNCHDGGCEEGIDCGGPCTLCKSIEVPYPFEEQRGILLYILTGIILLCLTAVLLYHYFRKEINATLAKAGWIISKKKRKQILLSDENKKKLLTGILDLERLFKRVELPEALNKYAGLLRYYLLKVSRDELAQEFDLEDLKKIMDKKRKIREILRKIFVSFFSKYVKVEQDKALITPRNLTLLIEELRNIVLQTSKVEPQDIAREIKELEIPEKLSPVDKMTVKITNTYIALQFLELGVAKKKYLDMLSDYEKLTVAEQEAIYEDIARLYHNISYVNSWHKKPIE